MVKKLMLISLGMIISMSIYAQESNTQIITEAGDPLEDFYVDGIVKRELITSSQMLKLDQPREADVAWEKKLWRVIDVREKRNQIFRSPIKPFFSILRDMAENGDVTVFRDEFFREPMAAEELDRELNRVDTTTVFKYETMEEEVKIVKSEINWENIKQFRVKEVWYFDKEVGVMKCRVLGISPILDEIDLVTGELKYTRPLFWIYYPEAREYLAKHRIQNDANDISPLTWDDCFEMRSFSSYIIKRSSTLDMRIEDQIFGNDRSGIDRLLASDNIKAELFNFEHDLWEY